jgi:hypothetical protein
MYMYKDEQEECRSDLASSSSSSGKRDPDDSQISLQKLCPTSEHASKQASRRASIVLHDVRRELDCIQQICSMREGARRISRVVISVVAVVQ